MAVFKCVNNKKALKSNAAMRSVMQYVLNPEKTDSEHCYVIGNYDGDVMDAQSVFLQFVETQKQFETASRKYAHSVISFHKDEGVSADDILTFAVSFAEKYYENHESLVVVHFNGSENPHAHIITNCTNYLDGSKLHKSRNDLLEARKTVDDLCRDYGFSITEKGKKFNGETMDAEIVSFDKDKYHLLTSEKRSYVADCGIAVLHSLKTATSKESFIEAMKFEGWETEWNDRKHIVFKNSSGEKVRGKNLLKTFGINATKEGLTNEFERKRNTAEQTKTIRSAGKQELDEQNRRDAKDNRRTSSSRQSR